MMSSTGKYPYFQARIYSESGSNFKSNKRLGINSNSTENLEEE